MLTLCDAQDPTTSYAFHVPSRGEGVGGHPLPTHDYFGYHPHLPPPLQAPFGSPPRSYPGGPPFSMPNTLTSDAGVHLASHAGFNLPPAVPPTADPRVPDRTRPFHDARHHLSRAIVADIMSLKTAPTDAEELESHRADAENAVVREPPRAEA
jgi:hypothetical protein